MAPSLEQFVEPWCASLRSIRDDIEKVRRSLEAANAASPACLPVRTGHAHARLAGMWASISRAAQLLSRARPSRPRSAPPRRRAQEHAFRGLCEMIKLNPRGVIAHFAQLCDAIATWNQPPAELDENFRAILTGYKSSVAPEAWAQYYGTFPEYIRSRLTQRYGI